MSETRAARRPGNGTRRRRGRRRRLLPCAQTRRGSIPRWGAPRPPPVAVPFTPAVIVHPIIPAVILERPTAVPPQRLQNLQLLRRLRVKRASDLFTTFSATLVSVTMSYPTTTLANDPLPITRPTAYLSWRISRDSAEEARRATWDPPRARRRLCHRAWAGTTGTDRREGASASSRGSGADRPASGSTCG